MTSSNLTKWKGSIDFQARTPMVVIFAMVFESMLWQQYPMVSLLMDVLFHFVNFSQFYWVCPRCGASFCIKQIPSYLHNDSRFNGLGEDGPTHQPIEILSLLRATPNMLVLDQRMVMKCLEHTFVH